MLCDDILDNLIGARIWFKCENLQRIGAFKFRGACNAVLALTEVDAARGVLTHSSGNHGAALGLAARIRGVTAHIVVPENAPAIKLANMRATGAVIHMCAATLAARETIAAQVQSETGAVLIHPFTNPDVIAGQGTATLELLMECADIDTLVAPVGGGGLICGSAIAAHAISSDIEIIAAEPEGAADAARALQSGQREINPQADTLCDGLRTGIGEINFHLMQKEQVKVLTANDDETIAAMRLIWERLHVIAEPSSAVTLAVLIKYRQQFAGRNIGVILSGGNVDLDQMPWLHRKNS